MATSLLTLLDDLASLLDDVAAMTKVATQKTAGVLGDDLALNAEQVTGVNPDRELPVVWAVMKGSAKNKLILVPAALAISAVAHWLITPILMLGGAYLCFEGFEKLVHQKAKHDALAAGPVVDLAAFEQEKIAGAIRTDFVLSAEIVVITLGTVADAPFGQQVAVLVAIAVLMTVGVSGLVAGIVKLDDAGLALSTRAGAASRALGMLLVRATPYLMKALTIAGTVAMFLVGGGILAHGLPPVGHLVDALAARQGLVGTLGPAALNGGVGLLAGLVLVGLAAAVRRVRPGVSA